MQEAISHGLAILAWFENYVPDEIPNENLWDDSEAVEEHFRRIREKKDSDLDNGRGVPFGDDADAPANEMMGNDLASVFKQ